MAGEIRRWLCELGCEQYAENFEKNDLDLDIVADLADGDLKELGVASMGHRKILLRGIAAMHGTPADDITPDTPSPTAASQVERRHLTVLFCDLVGSTELSQALDPEDLRDLMRRYRDAVSGQIIRYGGHIASYMGDGLLAYFGWPQAYEDQAERAVRSGLDAVGAVGGLRLDDGSHLAARVGIATGQVVVGDFISEGGRDAEAVTGETPNLASRLQGLATPGQVVLCAATHRLLGQGFSLMDMGARDLKGFDEGVQAWRVVSERAMESRFEASQGADFTRFVGREHELALINDRWEMARGGEGQIVLLSGEAGIGKSRLTEALMAGAEGTPHFRLRFQCSPYHSNSALNPFIHQLERAARFEPADDDETKFDKLEALLRRAGDAAELSIPLIANLLSLPYEDRYGALDLTPQQIKQRTLEVLAGQLFGLAAKQPVLFLFEDAQWIDPTSLEMLELTVPRASRTSVLFVITYRPDWRAPFASNVNATSLQLNRLGRRQVAEFVRIVAARAVPEAMIERVIDRTDGIPLFVEEMTRSLVESGLSAAANANEIPDSLQASLMERLDRLSVAAKTLAQFASVIGREISLRLLNGATEGSEDDIALPIQELLRSQMMLQGGSSGEKTIVFRHALIRDAAYQSLLLSRRREIHAMIARALERDFPNIVHAQPELVARHYTEAGNVGSAFVFWRRAGERASKQLANHEAVDHFANALVQLGLMPPGPDRDRNELEILLVMGVPLIAATGYASDRVEKAFQRAEALCVELGDDENLFPVRRGLWNFYLDRPDFSRSLEVAEALIESTAQTGNPEEIALAHRALGSVKFYVGDFAGAQDEVEAGARTVDGGHRRANLSRYGEAGGVVCRTYLGWIEILRGRVDRGGETSRSAFEMARELDHPLSQAFACSMHLLALHLRRELTRLDDIATGNLEYCDKHGLVFWGAFSLAMKGCSVATMGDMAAGVDDVRRGYDLWRGTGAKIHVPYFLSILADLYQSNGRVEEGLQVIREALAEAQRNDEACWRAELHRLHGLLLHDAGDGPAALAELGVAVELARRQDAKWFELRATRDRARLLHLAGETQEAVATLAPIHAWFTEGRDLADLEEARLLLDEMRA